jgi:hypothetical protein
MNKFAISCFVALLVHSLAISQSITEYRYWWDDDISTVVTETVSAGQTLSLNFEIATTADLSLGHHTITFQVKDENDEWSVPVSRLFYQNGDLVEYEYWFDDDITASNTETVAQTDDLLVTSLDVSSLDAGIHKVTFRTLTNNGASSVPVSRYFKISGGNLISWEYWFDDDLGTRIQQSIDPPQNMLDLMDDLDASSLIPGAHTVTWRAEDTNSNWSVPITYGFDVVLGVEDIPGLESVLIYPSPTRDQLSIKAELNSSVNLKVEILNQAGQVVNVDLNGLSSNHTLLTMDVSSLAAGIYFVRLSSSEGFTSHKFVKQ